MGISLGYLGDILGISWEYIGDILGITWGISWGYLRDAHGPSARKGTKDEVKRPEGPPARICSISCLLATSCCFIFFLLCHSLPDIFSTVQMGQGVGPREAGAAEAEGGHASPNRSTIRYNKPPGAVQLHLCFFLDIHPFFFFHLASPIVI